MIRKRRSIASSEPTPRKKFFGEGTLRNLHSSCLTSSWVGEGYRLRERESNEAEQAVASAE